MDDQYNEYINYGHIYHLEIMLFGKYGETSIGFEELFRFFIL